jgi:hypothetical protein
MLAVCKIKELFLNLKRLRFIAKKKEVSMLAEI